MTVVVFLHVNWSGYGDSYYFQIKNIVGNAWDIPVFFMLGGFFLTRQKMVAAMSLIRRKFQSIYVKLIFYYVVFLIMHNVLIYAGFLSMEMDYAGKKMALFGIGDFIKSMVMALLFMGREPYIAPLWFVYVMFMSFIIIAALAFLTDRMVKGDERRWHVIMTVELAVLCSVSLLFTNSLGINIPRCNNVFTGAWLIFWGYLIRNILHVEFNRISLAVLSLLTLIGICICSSHMALITNSYSNIFQLTMAGLSALYLISYVSKKMEHSLAGRVIAYIGKNSYHIMALHLLAINLFVYVLNVSLETSYPICKLGSEASTFAEALVFTIMGILLPVAFIAVLKSISKRIHV